MCINYIRVIIIKEEFKAFVRKKPELISYVTKGDMTWQRFYEIWSLYGDDDKIWSKYKKTDDKVRSEIKGNNNQNFSLSSLIDWVKNVDMNQVQRGVNSMQKVVGLLQGLAGSKASSNASSSSYEPRQVFKKFED